MRSFTTRRHAVIAAIACLLARGSATNHAGEAAASAASPPFPVLPVAQSSAQVMSSPPALSYPGATKNQTYLALGMEMPIIATAGAGSTESAELIFVSPESYLLFVQQGMILDGSTQLNMSGGLLSSSADPFVSFEEPTGLFSSVSAANSGSSTGSSSSDMRLLAVLLYSPPTAQPGAAAFNWTAWAADMSANPSLRMNFDVQDFATRSGLGEPVAAEVLIVQDQVTATSDNPDDNSQSLVPISTVIPAAGQAESSDSASASAAPSATGAGGAAGGQTGQQKTGQPASQPTGAASGQQSGQQAGSASGSPSGLGGLLPGGMATGGAGGASQSSSAAGASGTGAAGAGLAGQSGSDGKEGSDAEKSGAGGAGTGEQGANNQGQDGQGQDGSAAATGANNGEGNDGTAKGSQGKGSGDEGSQGEGSQGEASQGEGSQGEGSQGEGSQGEGSQGEGSDTGGQGDAEKGKGQGASGGAGGSGASGDGANNESADDETGCDAEEEQGASGASAIAPGASGSNGTIASATGGAAMSAGGNKNGLPLMGTGAASPSGMASAGSEMDPAAPKMTATASMGEEDDDNDFTIGFDIDGKFGTTITAELPFRAARRTAAPQEGDWTMTLNPDARLALGGLMQATAASASDLALATGLSTMITTTTSGQDTLPTATTSASSASSDSTSLSSTLCPSSALRVLGVASVALAVLMYM